MVCLDDDGEVVRPALLWNDTRSAGAAADLVAELGGARRRRGRTPSGRVPVASFTVTKLRWLADARAGRRRRGRPRSACRTTGSPGGWRRAPASDALVTDRGDASGTGYWSPAAGDVPRRSARARARARRRRCPACSGPAERAGRTPHGAAARARHRRQRGRRARARRPRRATSSSRSARRGSSCAVSERAVRRRRPARSPASPTRRAASCRWSCTLNAARVLDADGRAARRRPRRAVRAGAGSARRARTGSCSCPTSRASAPPTAPTRPARVHGLRAGQRRPPRTWPAPPSRGCCAGSPTASTRWSPQGATGRARPPRSAAARSSEAVRRIAPTVLGRPVLVPAAGRVRRRRRGPAGRLGAVRGPRPPGLVVSAAQTYEADPAPAVRARYAEVRDLTASRLR